MTIQPFTADEWKSIFKAYKNTPQQQTGLEILRQHLLEDIRVDASLLTTESSWYRHYMRTSK